MAQTTTNPPPSAIEPESEKNWSFSAYVYGYIVPEDRDYAQPTLTADYHYLHLEARYNYEDYDTASLWVGANFSGGKELTWEITPMLGGAFGHTSGFAPGYKGTLSWWKLSLYSEGEFLVDTDDTSNSYFYNWSELTISPWDWLRLVLVTQRTRVYKSDRDVQRGLLAGVTYKRVDFTTYVFNPDDSEPLVVIAAGIRF
jgi:hypothetical protein